VVGFLALVFLPTLLSVFQGAGGDTRKLFGRWSGILRFGWRDGGGGAHELLRRWFKNFLIGPPITLKFGAEKIRE
jgi:hypothetical protein